MEPTFQPRPEYQMAALEDELLQARRRIVYLSACLRQMQAEANEEMARLTQEVQELRTKSDPSATGA